MEWLLWAVIILFFAGSLIGIFVPVIPDALLLWGGFLIYAFFIADQGLSSWFWWGAGALTLLIIIADTLTSMVFVRKYGGSKWGMAASVIGLMIGPFILGPFGILLGPLFLVLVVEWVRSRDASLSWKIAMGSIAAFFGSAAVKMILQIMMIIWFFIAV